MWEKSADQGKQNKTKQKKNKNLLDKHWRWLVDSKHGLNKDLSEILCPKAEQIPNIPNTAFSSATV